MSGTLVKPADLLLNITANDFRKIRDESPPLPRLAAPLVVSDEAVRLAVIDNLGWRTKFAEQPRQSRREMVNGESHYFLGRRYRLRVHEQDGPGRIAVRGIASLDLFVRRGSSTAQREAVLLRWHREQLRALLPPLLEKWQPRLEVQVAAWASRR